MLIFNSPLPCTPSINYQLTNLTFTFHTAVSFPNGRAVLCTNIKRVTFFTECAHYLFTFVFTLDLLSSLHSICLRIFFDRLSQFESGFLQSLFTRREGYPCTRVTLANGQKIALVQKQISQVGLPYHSGQLYQLYWNMTDVFRQA